MAFPKADVCIVGVGGCGGIAAYVLAQAGLKVVGLEAGAYNTKFNFKMDEMGSSGVRNYLGPKVNADMPTWRPNVNSKAVRAVPAGPTMNGVGGTSIHWCGQAWRRQPEDLKVCTNTIKRYGESALPAGTDIQDWPISYDDVEPYYEKVEYTTGISGKAGNLKGQTIDGGNIFEGPRQKEYPLPPLPANSMCLGAMFEQATKKMGYHPFVGAAGILSQNFDGRPACTYCGWCCGYGCHIDAKTSTLVSTIPKAVATKNFDLRPFSRVVTFNADDTGNLTSVTYLDAAGVAQTQEARLFILSSYTYENVRLLLYSKSKMFLNGLSNNDGMVGRYYMGHGNWTVNGIFPQGLNSFTGNQGLAECIDDPNGDNFDHTGLGFIRGTYVCARGQLTPISGSGNLPPGTPIWGADYKDFIRKNFNKTGALSSGGSAETLPYDANYIDLDPDVKDAQGIPVARVTFDFYDNEKKMWAYVQNKADEIMKQMGATTTWKPTPSAGHLSTHAQGGTRMGTDPKRSVVDKWCRSHEVPNLFIFSGSVNTTTSSYNPTETMQALAWRGSEEIMRQLK